MANKRQGVDSKGICIVCGNPHSPNCTELNKKIEWCSTCQGYHPFVDKSMIDENN